MCVRPRDARGVTGEGTLMAVRDGWVERVGWFGRSVVSAPRLYLPDSESEAEPRSASEPVILKRACSCPCFAPLTISFMKSAK